MHHHVAHKKTLGLLVHDAARIWRQSRFHFLDFFSKRKILGVSSNLDGQGMFK